MGWVSSDLSYSFIETELTRDANRVDLVASERVYFKRRADPLLSVQLTEPRSTSQQLLECLDVSRNGCMSPKALRTTQALG